ncbi:MAG: tetratricopeptide repeat protein [Cyanobacteriota bacterium]|nr:tetratricopeptide repeat protein [Cyanobacteriota bacterium]
MRDHSAAGGSQHSLPSHLPASLPETLNLALHYLEAGALASAAQLYQQVLAHNPRQPEALHRLGLIAHTQGNFQQAIRFLVAACQLQPNQPQAHYNLGVVLRQLGKWDPARIAFQQALQWDPRFVEAHNGLGLVWRAMGYPSEAVRSFQAALEIEPMFMPALANLAATYEMSGDLESAVFCYQRALTLQPEAAELHNNLGSVWRDMGHMDKAVTCFEQALALQPQSFEICSNLGITLHKQYRLSEAILYLERALQLNPNFFVAHISLGLALTDFGYRQQAREHFQTAQQLNPLYFAVQNTAHDHNQIGVILSAQDRLEEAKTHFQRALIRDPDYAEAHNNLGLIWQEQGHLELALACFQEAVRLHPRWPTANINLGLTLLLRGEWSRGFLQYEWRRGLPDFHLPQRFAQMTQPSLLLICEQGLGDSIQLVRYLPRLVEEGMQVQMVGPASLQRLFASLEGIPPLLPPQTPLPSADVVLPLLSLPYLLQTTLDSVPATVPYLRATTPPPLRLEGSLPKVGLVWASGFPNVTYHKRSMAWPEMAVLLEGGVDPAMSFYSLQKDIPLADERAFREAEQQQSLHDLSPYLNDFADTASLINQMDLIVSVDTSVAHLAGALGKPVWILLPYLPDWRWLMQRSDSPWYPTARLFRQTQAGNWSGVMQQVKQALGQFRDSQNL